VCGGLNYRACAARTALLRRHIQLSHIQFILFDIIFFLALALSGSRAFCHVGT
jgi:hypothetical protein